MRTLKRLAHAIQQPALAREHAAADEYSRAVADRYAESMGLAPSTEDRLETHQRATAGAPRIRIVRTK